MYWDFTYIVQSAFLILTTYITIALIAKQENQHYKSRDFIWLTVFFLRMSFISPRISYCVSLLYSKSLLISDSSLVFPCLPCPLKLLKNIGQYFTECLSVWVCLMIRLWFCVYGKNNTGFMCVLIDPHPGTWCWCVLSQWF